MQFDLRCLFCNIFNRKTTKFNKQTQRWSLVSKKEPKKYSYIRRLILFIFDQKKQGRGVLEESPGQKIQPNLASVPKPTKETLLVTQESRFKLKGEKQMQSNKPSS